MANKVFYENHFVSAECLIFRFTFHIPFDKMTKYNDNLKIANRIKKKP